MSVEKKIAELLAESKRLHDAQNQSEEVVVDQVEELEEGAAETIKAKGTGQGQGDNPDNKGNQGTDKPEVKTSKDGSKSGTGGVAGQASELGKLKQEEVTVDVSADVAALVSGEDLSEEFKTKAATIFEAAVVTRVKAELAKIQEEYDAKLVEEFVQIKEELVEKVDGYLGYITEQWMKQNELALESGIKSELAESFIDGIKRVFEEHYVDVPAEKYDVLGSLEEQVGELEDKLNESVNANIEMSKQLAEMQRGGIVSQLCDGLTDTEVEKFTTLASEIVCEDVDSYTKKLQTIRESYFSKAPIVAKDTVVAVEAGDEQMISESIAHYASAIAKLKK
jgi:hypothetical protein